MVRNVYQQTPPFVQVKLTGSFWSIIIPRVFPEKLEPISLWPMHCVIMIRRYSIYIIM